MQAIVIDVCGVCTSVCLSHGSTVCSAFMQPLPNYFGLLFAFVSDRFLLKHFHAVASIFYCFFYLMIFSCLAGKVAASVLIKSGLLLTGQTSNPKAIYLVPY